ncbi:FAD dependent oxidoreductase [Oleispira antarctica RB-8]|uniref:FAD dependent oxidoreductase n=1 Tax=Oleispira antarctica RB-8 TaxID=698738 RepID=R4YJH5_OLEAN|nr:FAD dependent oxidoreductase [Oleispira antarctica RB-8]
MVKPTLAVIGSGIAGLSAAWLLKDKYQVTLFERHTKPGMGAYAVDVGNDGKRVEIDIPLRIITSGYYHELFKLYRTLGVEIERTDHAGAFFTHTGGDVFHYKNYNLGKYSFSFLNSPKRLSRTNVQHGMAAIKFFHDIKKVNLVDVQTLTFGEFLITWPHANTSFIGHILMPMLSTICTCDYDSIKQYPAAIIVDYLACGVAEEGVWKATHGVADIVAKITQGYDVKTHSQIADISSTDKEVKLLLTSGEDYTFDHVVIATQPQHAGPMIAANKPELSHHFEQIKFATSEMVVHRDSSIYPRPWQDISPVCYSVDLNQQRPMATVCLNKSMPTVKDCLPVFQTWHPTTTIEPNKILASVTFERPVMSFETVLHIKEIQESMQKKDNRIWFCGSYLGGGIPLLEAGVRSSLHVANQLGITTPW